MATTRVNSLRLRGQNLENPSVGKMKAVPVSRSALHEIGNKVSKKTLDNKKKCLTRNVSVRRKVGTVTQKAAPKVENKNKAEEEPDSDMGPCPMEICEAEIQPSEHYGINMANVLNIDADDGENSQLVSEYVNDIYSYLRDLEKSYNVKPNYLQGKEITGRMRAILIDWLCQVHHRFRLLPETLYLTVSIVDRFLQVHPVSRNKLQLVGVTSMLLASKYEEMYSPEISDFVYITDNAYKRPDIIKMELLILNTLDFKLGKPLCLNFLRRNSKAGQVCPNTHNLAKYIMELTIIEYEMVHYNPSLIAAAALCFSIKVLSGGDWTDTLSYYSTYTMNDLSDILKKIAKLVLKVESSKLTAVRSKYQSSKFFKISETPELKGEIIKQLAEC